MERALAPSGELLCLGMHAINREEAGEKEYEIKAKKYHLLLNQRFDSTSTGITAISGYMIVCSHLCKEWREEMGKKLFCHAGKWNLLTHSPTWQSNQNSYGCLVPILIPVVNVVYRVKHLKKQLDTNQSPLPFLMTEFWYTSKDCTPVNPEIQGAVTFFFFSPHILSHSGCLCLYRNGDCVLCSFSGVCVCVSGILSSFLLFHFDISFRYGIQDTMESWIEFGEGKKG